MKIKDLQRLCLRHFRQKYPKFNRHIISTQQSQTRAEQANITRLMIEGSAHLFIAVPRNGFAGLWILLKTPHRLDLTPAQQSWRDAMRSIGYEYRTAKNVQDFIKHIRRYMDSQINEAMVEQVVCRHYGVDPVLLHTKTSKQDIVRARQLSCFFSQIVTGKPDATISFKFFADHVGGIHGRNVIRTLYASDHEYRERVDKIMSELMISPKHMKQ